ncbi:MAG: hypothetical protein HXY51_12175 [Nitrospirae bacterium]|nr:hypothetical protein [Nitrospirota bacterium]
MTHLIKSKEDLRWLMGHTGGFRGGYVTDVHVSKRRLLDEASGLEVPAGTTVTVVIRYRMRQMARVVKLTMTGVTDFSMFEQEGADCSTLGVIQAELNDGNLRFWFDPQGELYVVCEEAQLEEVAAPSLEPLSLEQVAQWTFQSTMPEWPTVNWLLTELDVAGIPCIWRAIVLAPGHHSAIQWQGELLPASMEGALDARGIHCMLYAPLDGPGFGMVLRVRGVQDRRTGQVLSILADLIAQRFSGQCLVGNTIIPGEEWQNWRSLGQQRGADG